MRWRAKIKWRTQKRLIEMPDPIHQQRVLSNSSMMCGPPYENIVLPYGYEEYAENSSDTVYTEEEENHNEALTMPGPSPAIQQSLQDRKVCRVALSCHFALDILYMSTPRHHAGS